MDSTRFNYIFVHMYYICIYKAIIIMEEEAIMLKVRRHTWKELERKGLGRGLRREREGRKQCN